MRILIIGINHQIQHTTIFSSGVTGKPQAFERSQKEAFEDMIRGLITNGRVQFLAEEALHGIETTTYRACRLENCRHANVEMPPEERLIRGIPDDYHNQEKNIPENEKEEYDRQREAYMITKTLEGAEKSESIILVCGRMHTASLAEQFRKYGHTVETTDLQDRSWYVEDWAHHVMYRL